MGRRAATLRPVSSFAAKNLGAIKAAVDQHNADCPVPANAILLNPVDHALIDFDELWGLPVLADERVVRQLDRERALVGERPDDLEHVRLFDSRLERRLNAVVA